MPKITIYVQDDLKAEMDAAEAQQPNWSGIAQEAFKNECQRIANRKRSKGKMEEVIERLRKSKDKFSNDEKVNGDTAGRKWAMERAEFEELERLDALELPSLGVPALQEPAWEIFRAIGGHGEERPDVQEYREFWESWYGVGTPSDDFVGAFFDGALEVFHEVADKL